MCIPDGKGGRLDDGEGAPLVVWVSEDVVPLVALPSWCAQEPLVVVLKGAAASIEGPGRWPSFSDGAGALVNSAGLDGGAYSAPVHW
jgi:hypothetical protein